MVPPVPMSDSDACKALADLCATAERTYGCLPEPPGAAVIWRCRVVPARWERARPHVLRVFKALAGLPASWAVGSRDGVLLLTVRAGSLAADTREALTGLPASL